jgi:PIN domain nuclease of toxin-antitoxin system
MRCLLDTHIILWFAKNSPQLSDEAKASILDEANENYLKTPKYKRIEAKIY